MEDRWTIGMTCRYEYAPLSRWLTRFRMVGYCLDAVDEYGSDNDAAAVAGMASDAVPQFIGTAWTVASEEMLGPWGNTGSRHD